MRPSLQHERSAREGGLRRPGFADLELRDHEFQQLQRLIEAESGIHLTDSKRALLEGRLAGRLRQLGIRSFLAYYRRASSSSEELRVMLDRITTNETRFFREPSQFGLLSDRILPEWRAEAEAGRRRRRVRVWSAACSSGEEPYSIAMLLLEHFPPSDGWRVEVLGTDISDSALGSARAGEWPLGRSTEIPRPYLERFMLRGTGPYAGSMRVGEELRRTVRIDRLNLCGDRLPADAFDLVLCRNALIYFRAQTRMEVVRRLVGRLNPGGLLLLGHAESLTDQPLSLGLRAIMPTVYRREEADATG